jgi:AcrR family transcriptional regulator
MEKSRENVENEIIEAATKVFIAKGYKGATMRHIALKADINLAMLNYYFRSKDNLFDIIFERAFEQIYGRVFSVVTRGNSMFDNITEMVSEFIDILVKNPYLSSFIFSEISVNPERLTNKLKNAKETEKVFAMFQKQIDKEVADGIIKPITFMELFMDIDSLCAFPFIAQPMFKKVFNISDMNFGVLMERRKTSITELLIAGIRK